MIGHDRTVTETEATETEATETEAFDDADVQVDENGVVHG